MQGKFMLLLTSRINSSKLSLHELSNIFMLEPLPYMCLVFLWKNIKNQVEKFLNKIISLQSTRRKLGVGQILLENTDWVAMNFSLAPFQFL